MVEQNEITAARAELGFTPPQLAAALGVNQSTVWRWENGVAPISALAKRAITALIDEKRNAEHAA